MNQPEFGKSSGTSAKTTKSVPLKKNHWFVRLLLLLVILFSFGSMALYWVVEQVLPAKFSEPGVNPSQKQLIVKAGSGLNSIANQLTDAGLIAHPMWFRVKGKLDRDGAPLKAGEYLIQPHASINDIYAQMQTGKVLQHSLTIAEGLTVRAVIRILQENDLLVGDIQTIPPEGSLLPETFYFERGMNRTDILSRMATDQDQLLTELWAGRDPDLPLAHMNDALILASIVEKETGIASERDRVAAVFINRLRKGMRLESDPTILYGINGGAQLGRGLRRSEIDKKTPWNTYQIDGLPPTPICNPGRAAIYATLHPANSRALYFVADGAGGHSFSRTYAEHLQNVTQLRKRERQKRREAGK